MVDKNFNRDDHAFFYLFLFVCLRIVQPQPESSVICYLNASYKQPPLFYLIKPYSLYVRLKLTFSDKFLYIYENWSGTEPHNLRALTTLLWVHNKN